MDNYSETANEEILAVLKKGASAITDKKQLFHALEWSTSALSSLPSETSEETLLHILPCIKNLLIEVYNENCGINSKENLDQLTENLAIAISLTDFVGKIMKHIVSNWEMSVLCTIKSIFQEVPDCFHLTYKHCKQSQKKYQGLLHDCNQILELYRRNQEYYTEFINFLNTMSSDDYIESYEFITQVLQSMLSIIQTLFGLNVKALADSWKVYCSLVEKYHSVLVEQKIYCNQEIEMLSQQIQDYMDMVLKNDEEKQRLQYTKLCGFLLKVAVKILEKFWDDILTDFDLVHKFVSSIYSYSPQFLEQSNLTIETRQAIKSCLCEVLTSFVDKNILIESCVEKILFCYNNSKHKQIGCMVLDVRIWKYISTQPSNSVDYVFLRNILKHIFHDISAHAPGNCHMTTFTLYQDLYDEIAQCVINHSAVYNEDFENLLMSKVLGNDIYCHIFACEMWIKIIRLLTTNSRMRFLMGLIKNISNIKIDLSFNSAKIVLLNRFIQRLFSTLSEVEKMNILKIYPPHKLIALWSVIGCDNISVNHKIFIDPLLESVLAKAQNMESIASCEDLIETIEAFRLLSSMNFSVLEPKSEKILNEVQKLWELNYEEVDPNNCVLKLFVSKLCQVTVGFFKHLSNTQILCILNRMKALSTISYFKLHLCSMLNTLTATRPVTHNMEQNKLNFLISDLFEILLKENDDTVRERGLEVFKKFAHNNQYIIVNNVSRMLPDMNLENYLQNATDKNDLKLFFDTTNMETLEHTCLLRATREENKKIFRKRSNEVIAQETPNEFSRKIMNNHAQRSSYNKKIKLDIDVPEEEDTIDEVLQRIKGEIKCLNKVLSKERLTPKNARDIKMLGSMLQNTLESS